MDSRRINCMPCKEQVRDVSFPKQGLTIYRCVRRSMQNPTDEEIKEILKSARNVAAVGLSDKPGRVSHRVAAYLKRRGSLCDG